MLDHLITLNLEPRSLGCLSRRFNTVVKECVHIDTGKYYACKVISKRLMAGRESMVRNEIAVLKKISQGHPNVLTLIDYFETTNNLYLVFDLCTGGELFDRICAKGCKQAPFKICMRFILMKADWQCYRLDSLLRERRMSPGADNSRSRGLST